MQRNAEKLETEMSMLNTTKVNYCYYYYVFIQPSVTSEVSSILTLQDVTLTIIRHALRLYFKTSSLDRSGVSVNSRSSFGNRTSCGMAPHMVGSTPDLTQYRRLFPTSASAETGMPDHFKEHGNNDIPHYATYSR